MRRPLVFASAVDDGRVAGGDRGEMLTRPREVDRERFHMTPGKPSIVSHMSLGTRDMDRALRFHDAVMATIGARRREVIELDEVGTVAVACGKALPEFWIQLPDDRESASVGNGVHVGFVAPGRETVHRFHEVAFENGGTDEGAPGARPHCGESCYGCFVRDPDGNEIEAFRDAGDRLGDERPPPSTTRRSRHRSPSG